MYLNLKCTKYNYLQGIRAVENKLALYLYSSTIEKDKKNCRVELVLQKPFPPVVWWNAHFHETLKYCI